MSQTKQQTLAAFNHIESMLDFIVKLSNRHIDIAHITQYHNELNSAKVELDNISLDSLTVADKKRHAELKDALLREIDTFNALATSAVAKSVSALHAEPIDLLLESGSETNDATSER